MSYVPNGGDPCTYQGGTRAEYEAAEAEEERSRVLTPDLRNGDQVFVLTPSGIEVRTVAGVILDRSTLAADPYYRVYWKEPKDHLPCPANMQWMVLP